MPIIDEFKVVILKQRANAYRRTVQGKIDRDVNVEVLLPKISKQVERERKTSLAYQKPHLFSLFNNDNSSAMNRGGPSEISSVRTSVANTGHQLNFSKLVDRARKYSVNQIDE